MLLHLLTHVFAQRQIQSSLHYPFGKTRVFERYFSADLKAKRLNNANSTGYKPRCVDSTSGRRSQVKTGAKPEGGLGLASIS